MTTDFERVSDRTINAIAELADRAKNSEDKVSIRELPNDPYGSSLIIKNDGTYERYTPLIHPRSSRLRSVDQVADYVISAIDRWNSTPAVYFQEHEKGAKVQIPLVDSNLEMDFPQAQVDLTYTPQFSLLRTFGKNHDGAWMSQKAFMLMLRLKLCTCIRPEVLETTIKALGAYEAMEGSRTVGTIARNYESIGKEVKAEMRANAGDIPPELVLQVRVFDDRSLLTTRRVLCKLETDPANGGKFALIPIADEIENAIDQEMTELGEMLRKAINGSNLPRLTGPAAAQELPAGTDATPTVPTRPYVPVFYGQF